MQQAEDLSVLIADIIEIMRRHGQYDFSSRNILNGADPGVMTVSLCGLTVFFSPDGRVRLKARGLDVQVSALAPANDDFGGGAEIVYGPLRFHAGQDADITAWHDRLSGFQALFAPRRQAA